MCTCSMHHIYVYTYNTTHKHYTEPLLNCTPLGSAQDIRRNTEIHEFPTCRDYPGPYVGVGRQLQQTMHFDFREQTNPIKPSEHKLSTLSNIESIG